MRDDEGGFERLRFPRSPVDLPLGARSVDLECIVAAAVSFFLLPATSRVQFLKLVSVRLPCIVSFINLASITLNILANLYHLSFFARLNFHHHH